MALKQAATATSRGGAVPTAPVTPSAGTPYSGARPRVAFLDQPSVKTFSGSANWNLSVGIGSGVVSVGTDPAQGPAYVNQIDLGQISALAASNDAVTNDQEGLVFYDIPGTSVHPGDIAGGTTSGRPAPAFMNGVQPVTDWPKILGASDAVHQMKLALWLLIPSLNTLGMRLATLLGKSYTPVPITDPAHLYLDNEAVSAAAVLLTVISQGMLGRALSADAAAFLQSPTVYALATMAPAIVVDTTQAFNVLSAATSLAVNPASLPYQGPLAKIAKPGGGTTKVTTGNGQNDWNRSIASATACAASDQVCSASRAGADVIIGYANDGASPLGLVSYYSPVYQVNAVDFQSPLPPAPAVLTQPGMEAKLGLWYLETLLNATAIQLGSTQVVYDGVYNGNRSHIYLIPNHAIVAQALLPQIAKYLPSGRGLSPATQAFLSGPPTVEAVALAAPSISYDLASAQEALSAAAQAGGGTSTTAAAASSSMLPWIAGGVAVAGVVAIAAAFILKGGGAAAMGEASDEMDGAEDVDLQDLGTRLHHWHASQGDPIYGVGSLLYSGDMPAKDDLEAARREIDVLARGVEKRPTYGPQRYKDLKELLQISSELQELIDG